MKCKNFLQGLFFFNKFTIQPSKTNCFKIKFIILLKNFSNPIKFLKSTPIKNPYYSKNFRINVQAPKSTFTNGSPQTIYLATDRENFYVPEQYAKSMYRLFNLTLDKNENYYYKACDELNELETLHFYVDNVLYVVETRYLFTPVGFLNEKYRVELRAL